jgi:hypothetical protein
VSTDANKLERIQQKFAALCFNRVFPQVHYNYIYALEQLKLHTLRKRSPPFSGLPWFYILLGISENSLCSMSSVLVKTVFIPAAFQLLVLFCMDVDVFRAKTLSLNHIL